MGHTPLHVAVDAPMFESGLVNQPKTVSKLLDAGALVNFQDLRSNNLTPLFIASQWGFVNIVSILLERGADPFLTDVDGRTALDHATDLDWFDVVDVLHAKMVELQPDMMQSDEGDVRATCGDCVVM